MKNMRFNLLLIVFLVLLLAGCSEGDLLPGENIIVNTQEDNTQGKGTLKLYLTDAPGEYDAVNILISHIDAHIAEAEQEQEQEGSLNYQNRDNEQNEEEGVGGEWFTLEYVPADPIDLIALQGQSLFLSSTELPAGLYTQLRVFLSEEGASIVVDEEEKDLLIPSSAQTGIKLTHPFEIAEGETTELTLDFDAYKSIIETGNGDYMMKPTIKVISGSSSL